MIVRPVQSRTEIQWIDTRRFIALELCGPPLKDPSDEMKANSDTVLLGIEKDGSGGQSPRSRKTISERGGHVSGAKVPCKEFSPLFPGGG